MDVLRRQRVSGLSMPSFIGFDGFLICDRIPFVEDWRASTTHATGLLLA